MKVTCLSVEMELEPAIAYRLDKLPAMDGALRGNRCLVESLLDALDEQALEEARHDPSADHAVEVLEDENAMLTKRLDKLSNEIERLVEETTRLAGQRDKRDHENGDLRRALSRALEAINGQGK